MGEIVLGYSVLGVVSVIQCGDKDKEVEGG